MLQECCLWGAHGSTKFTLSLAGLGYSCVAVLPWGILSGKSENHSIEGVFQILQSWVSNASRSHRVGDLHFRLWNDWLLGQKSSADHETHPFYFASVHTFYSPTLLLKMSAFTSVCYFDFPRQLWIRKFQNCSWMLRRQQWTGWPFLTHSVLKVELYELLSTVKK